MYLYNIYAYIWHSRINIPIFIYPIIFHICIKDIRLSFVLLPWTPESFSWKYDNGNSPFVYRTRNMQYGAHNFNFYNINNIRKKQAREYWENLCFIIWVNFYPSPLSCKYFFIICKNMWIFLESKSMILKANTILYMWLYHCSFLYIWCTPATSWRLFGRYQC